MSESCSNNCSECNIECNERNNVKSFIEKTEESTHIKKVIGIISGKGGVGKSVVTSLLAHNMQKEGYNVAILDADITGPSIPKMFGVHEKSKNFKDKIMPVTSSNNIKIMSVNFLLKNENDPVIWRGPLIGGAVKQFWTDVIWGDIDYMFIDMPPGTGDVPLTVFQTIPINGIIIVTTPQDLVSLIVEKSVKMAKKMNIPVLGIVENMSYFECPNCKQKHNIFGNSNIEEICDKYNIKSIDKIPINSEIANLCDSGLVMDISDYYLNNIMETIKN